MSSPVLNRVWYQSLEIKPSAYAIFFKAGLIWLTLLLFFDFITACLLASLLFVFLKHASAQRTWGLSLSPEGECRYYPYDSRREGTRTAAIRCKPIVVRYVLFWCYLLLQAEDGKRHQLIICLHTLKAQEKRRFNALCHNWSQEIMA